MDRAGVGAAGAAATGAGAAAAIAPAEPSAAAASTAPAPEPARPARAAAADRAQQVARLSYGRLVAVLAARTGNIAAAEDALADAFERALRLWPERGIPDNPEGWLVTVARNRWLDALRAAHPLPPLDEPNELDPDRIPDKRLELLFVCAHPAIDPAVRAPLMLQVVFGLEASVIATAFAMPTATMAQRLVRAKRRIRDARIPFVVPALADMPARLPAVLEAIYGVYAIEWQVISGMTVRESLAPEALHLATLLAELLPAEPEAHGLAALLAFSIARAPARIVDGMLVPLDQQRTDLWRPDLIAEGEALLRRAHAFGRIGRFQLEAAIQSAHCARRVTGATDWASLVTLYTALVTIAPTLGGRVSLAAVTAELRGSVAGLAALDGVPGVEAFQPAWATRAHLLAESGRADAAAAAYAKAISLTADPAARRLLEAQAARVASSH